MQVMKPFEIDVGSRRDEAARPETLLRRGSTCTFYAVEHSGDVLSARVGWPWRP